MGTETLEGAAIVFSQLGVRLQLWIALFCCPGVSAAQDIPPNPAEDCDRLIVVVGAAGTDEFAGEFSSWADEWEQLARRQQWQLTRIEEPADAGTAREQLEGAVRSSLKSSCRLWIVFLGHGTFARDTAKFNLIGPDVSANDLKGWLKGSQMPVVVVNCSSASAPFLTKLAGPDRVLLTATRSGSEINYSRFGKYLSLAINDPEADIDHDQEVSLLEAFLAATSETERFYLGEARLTTEHALLDDNGDRVGTTGDFYRGILPAKQAEEGKQIDGAVASRMILYSSPGVPVFPPELEARRLQIERQIDQLRNQKDQLAQEHYYDQLESLMLELAQAYDLAEANQ